MGDMKRRNAYDGDQLTGSRYVSTLVIASTIIPAVRLASDDIRRPSPKVLATLSEGVSLARSLLEAVYGDIRVGEFESRTSLAGTRSGASCTQ